MRHLAPLALAALLLFNGLATAEMTTYTVQKGADGNEVVFVSKAVGETFDGRTKQVEGTFSCDPDDLTQPVSGKITVPVKTLDTGIGLRNNHMFENHLHPDEYPTITFELTGLVDPPKTLTRGIAQDFKGEGEFTLHGVTRSIEPDLVVELQDDGSIRVEADWTVRLDEYNIPRPQFLFAKLAQEQEVSATFTAVPE